MPVKTLHDEPARASALDSYAILDSPPEREFNDLVEIAAALCAVPIALVSFMAPDRHWFKAARGLGDLREIFHRDSFCTHALAERSTLVVPDTYLDLRFTDNPFVAGFPNVRAYIGVPIVNGEGDALGTVSVIDVVPRTFLPEQIHALEALARQAHSLLERRRVDRQRQKVEDERQRAVGAARQSQEQLELAVEAAGLAVWYYDPEAGTVGGDETMAYFFGMKVPEGPAEAWLSAIVDEDRSRVGAEFAASLAGAPYDTVYRVRVDGEVRWLHAQAKITTNADDLPRMVGICDDVTAETVLKHSLARTAERLAIAQQASRVVSFEWDIASDVITWSGDLFGRTVADLRSAVAFFAVVHDEDRKELQNALHGALETGSSYVCEFRLYSPDGEVRWYRTSGKPILDELGRPQIVVGVNFDITDRKRADAMLLQTEKLAAVGRLASVVAHEINNPLEAVTNLLYLSRLRPASPQQEEWLIQADRELRRISAMASQTLRFHRQSTNPQPITCLSLFSATLDLYEARFLNRRITVEKRKRANEPILCFESDLRQVLSNIVTNAIDAMADGGRLLVRSRQGTDWRTGDKGLILTVADTGTGMPDRVQRRLFEPFYTTKGINGSGLGLWISQQIMARHEGKIRLRSSNRPNGHDTVVSLFLPFGRVPVPRAAGSLE